MTSAGVPRGKNFNPDELRQLSKSWIAISVDNIKGSGQKADSFWERIAEDYNANKDAKYATRSAKSLETKTGDVRKDCAKFKGCVDQVTGLDFSGDNLEDTYEKAKELFKKKSEALKTGKKEFAYSCCYEIMDKDPRLGVPPDAGSKGKKSKSTTGISRGGNRETFSSSPSPASVGGDSELSDFPADDSSGTKMAGDIRPMGTKAAKLKKLQLKMEESSQRIAADAHRSMAETAAERLKVVESQSLMMLLSMPGFQTDPETLEFLRASRLAEIERLKKRLIAPRAGASTNDSLPPRKASRGTNDSPSTHQEMSSPSEADTSEAEAQFHDTSGIAMRSSLPIPEFNCQGRDEEIITM